MAPLTPALSPQRVEREEHGDLARQLVASPTSSPLPEGEGQGEGSEGRLAPTPFRRALRRASTPAERKLWSLLRSRQLAGLKVRRQHTVGPYTVDFYCHEAGLAVEVDGSIHDGPARNAADTARQLELAKNGIRVVRVTNEEVLTQPEAALARILEGLESPHPRIGSGAGSVPLPGGEGTLSSKVVPGGRGAPTSGPPSDRHRS